MVTIMLSGYPHKSMRGSARLPYILACSMHVGHVHAGHNVVAMDQGGDERCHCLGQLQGYAWQRAVGVHLQRWKLCVYGVRSACVKQGGMLAWRVPALRSCLRSRSMRPAMDATAPPKLCPTSTNSLSGCCDSSATIGCSSSATTCLAASTTPRCP